MTQYSTEDALQFAKCKDQMPLSKSRIKLIRKLSEAKERRRREQFLIEGEKLVREALTSSSAVQEVFAVEDRVEELRLIAGEVPLTLISSLDCDRIADTKTSQGCFALVSDFIPNVDQIPKRMKQSIATVVILDGVQDPGNVGTVIRSSAAFGVDLVVCSSGSADLTNPKVVRAATGAWFRVPLARCTDLNSLLFDAKSNGWSIFVATPGGISVRNLETLAPHRMIVFGSEGKGVTAAVNCFADERIGVDITEEVDSLNVSVAAGILLSQIREMQTSSSS